tara:strand:- start:2145 stop:3227 length:1083 start_codon:yes stop_codon:yes gene_type:complete
MKLVKWGVFFLIVFGIFYLWNQGYTEEYLAGNYFFGGIINNSLESKNMSSLTFSKINNVRKEKLVNELKYNKNSYNLAVTLSKKFQKSREYYIVEEEIINLSESYKVSNVKILSKKLDKLEESEFNLMSLEWSSRDLFTEKTLNENFTDGAVGCYKEVCVFVLSVEVEPVVSKTDEITIDYFDEKISNDFDENTDVKSPSKKDIDIYALEKEIHALINNERINMGLNSLSFSEELTNIARGHSQDMALNNYFEHDNLKGQDPTDRAISKGYNCYKDYGSYYTEGVAENIFQNNLYDSVSYVYFIPIYNWNSQLEIAQSTVVGWMNSPGHRANILTSTYDTEGIGVAISGDDKVYITENFC